MDYLETAKYYLDHIGPSEPDAARANANADAAGAYALAAIAEHLVAFGTGAAMRREIDKLAIGLENLERGKVAIGADAPARLASVERRIDSLISWRNEISDRVDGLNEIESKLAGVVVQHVNDFAGIDREIETVKRQQTANLDAVAALGANADLRRLDAGVASLGLWRETAREQLDEIARRLKKVESEDVELGRYVKNVLEGRFANIERKLPDAPRVGVWQRCTECEGKGLDPDPDKEGARCGVCGGRGMVEVFVASGRTSEAEWADKLQEAHFSVASLGRKLEESRRTIDEILQVVNDSDLSREEMIKEVDKALR